MTDLAIERVVRSMLTLLVCATMLVGCRVKIGDGDRAWNDLVAGYRHDVSVGDFNMHCIDMGEGPAVVLVHGFGDSTYCFHENVQPLLAAGHRVILVDQPGMGRSEIPPDGYTYSIENQAANVLKVIDSRGVDRFAVVGSSMGGGIALQFALRHGDRVTHVVGLDPASFSIARQGIAPLARRPGLRDMGALVGGRAAGYIVLWDVYYDRSKVDDKLVDEYARPLNKPGYREALIRLLTEYESDEFAWMGRNYWKIQTPTLLVWGAADAWLPVRHGHKLHRKIPGSRLEIIARSGHLPHQERPACVNPILTEFLGS